MTIDKYAAIEQVIRRWAWAHDSHDADLIAGTFATDAEAMGVAGRDAIAEAYRTSGYQIKSAQRRHTITNLQIVDDGGDRVVVRHYLTLQIIRGKAVEAHTAGFCLVTVVLEDGDWKIWTRTSVVDSASDPGDLPIQVPAGTHPGR